MIIKNFLFHRVSEEKDELWPPMHPQLFKKVIHHLIKNYEVVQLESFLQNNFSLKSKKPLVTISFDDGYKDNIDIAAPILKECNCAASFYVVTQCIDENLPTWTYMVDYFFQQERNTIELPNDFVLPKFFKLKWQTKEQGILLGRRVKLWMKALQNNQRVWVLNQLQKQSPQVKLPANYMMSWDEVKQLYNAGFYIGSHSHTHPVLTSLTNEDEIKFEMETSRIILEKHLKYKPLTISYPIGSFDERVVKAAEEAGYNYGLVLKQRFFYTNKDNVFAIPRIELGNEPWWKMMLRIKGVYQKIKKLVG